MKPPAAAYSAEAVVSAAKAGSRGVFGEREYEFRSGIDEITQERLAGGGMASDPQLDGNVSRAVI